MRHSKHSPKFGRRANHRTAMFRNMVTSLLRHGHLETTEAKAKELRSWADHMITLGKRGDLHARRQALAVIKDEKVVQKLFSDLGPRFKERPGGYTRVTKLAQRQGDGAHMAMIELVAEEK
jgi:large subunit ribosomal protein L17